MTAIGKMRERIVIQTVPTVVGAIGNVAAATPVTFATVWAQVKPVRASEDVVAERLSATAVFQIIVRYLPGLSPAMRILWDGRVLNIDSIRNLDERRRFLTIVAQDVGADAGAT